MTIEKKSKLEPENSGKSIVSGSNSGAGARTSKSKMKKKQSKALKRAEAAVSKFVKKTAAANMGLASNTLPGPASIEELARALKNDVDLIFQFVHDNIDFYPMYGVQKGAFGTLVDGIGNPFDQSALLVALLREAGYTADFMFGEIELTPAQLKNWLGTDDTDPNVSSDLLDAVGIPHTVNMTGPTWDSTTLDHLWVKVDIGGTDYVFDPSFKTYTYETGVNLASAIGFNKSTFQSNAQSGATITSTSVLNMNKSNIFNDLNGYSQALLSYIQSNMPDASLDEVIGGRKIVAVSGPVRQTSLPYETGTPTQWSSIPNAYRTTVRLQFPKFGGGSADITYYSDDIYHKRLAFWINAFSYPELWLEGTPVILGEWPYPNNLTITITHNAIAGATETMTTPYGEVANRPYVIALAFGPCTKASADYHKTRLQQYVRAGGSSVNYFSENILGETYMNDFFTYMAILTKNSDMLGRIKNCMPIYMHHGGFLAYVSLHQALLMSMFFGKTLGFADLDAGTSTKDACSDVYSVLVNGSEAMMARQQLEANTIGTNRAMEAATNLGVTIYDVNASNWSTISPSFYSWDSTYLTMLKTRWIDNGGRGILPANGSMGIDGLLANGFYASLPTSNHFAALSFGQKGITTTDPSDPTKQAEGSMTSDESSLNPPTYLLSMEPIDLASGAYLYNKTDMTVGSGAFPYSLPFSRHYRSNQWSMKSSVGYGWQHSYDCSARKASVAYSGLGDASAIFAAANITALYALSELLVDPNTDALADVVTAALIERWKGDQVKLNTVVLDLGNSADFLMKLADGTYAPLDARGSSVTINGSSQFVYKTRSGDTMTFSSAGVLLTWAKPNGVTLTFTTSGGLLQSVDNGIGRKLLFRYDSNGKLTQVFDNSGRDIGFTYDSTGNLISCRDEMGRETTYEYDGSSRLEKIFLPENPTSQIVTNAYDSLGRVMTQTDGESNQWTYYFAGSRSEEVDPLTNATVAYFNRHGQPTLMVDQLGNETVREYDSLRRETKRTMPEGNSFEMTYDENSNLLTLTKIAKPGSGLSDIVNTFTYDLDWNKVETAEDGEGNVTTNTYDSLTGDLLNIQRPTIGGITPQVSFTYNARGQMATMTDETGIVTKWNYDTDTEALLSVVRDFGTSPHLNLTTSFEYDKVGNVVAVTDPRGNRGEQTFDASRHVVETIAPEPFEFITQFEYDKNNRLVETRRLAPGVPIWQKANFSYNVSGDRTSMSDALGNTTNYFYNQRRKLQSVEDPESRTTTFTYDARAMLETVTDWSNNLAETRTYTDNGKLHELTDANSNTTEYTYDGFDRLAQTIYPDTTFEENTSYDDNDNLLVFTTRNGDTVTNTFDVLNRLETRTPQGMPTITYGYDLAGRRTDVSTPTVGGDPGSGAFQYFFDSAGRYFKEEYPDGKQVTMQLDANGNVTKLTYPDSYYVERVYDELNRLTDIRLNGSATPEATISYDILSRRANVEFANGTSSEYEFSLTNDMTGLAHSFVGSSANFAYGFNDAHQLTSQNVSDDQFVWHPASAGTVTYAAANDLNQYPTVGGVSYTYNNNGCLTGDGVWTFGYDVLNRFISAVKSGVSASYLYDPMDRQSQKNVGGTKTRFIYNGLQRIAEYDGTAGTLNTRFVYATGLDEPIVEVSSGGTKTFFHRDRLGSIIARTNNSGAVTQRYEYGPYGESAALSGTSFGYTGQRYDAESGLYNYKARYYSPVIGRFLQPDVIGYADGLNLYRYVRNQPVNFVDTLGLASDQGSKIAPADPFSDSGSSPLSDQFSDGNGQIPQDPFADSDPAHGLFDDPVDPFRPGLPEDKGWAWVNDPGETGSAFKTPTYAEPTPPEPTIQDTQIHRFLENFDNGNVKAPIQWVPGIPE